MESVSEKTERNTSEDKFNSKILTEKPTSDELEKVGVGTDEHVNDTHLEAMAEFHTKAKMIPFNDVEKIIGHAAGGVCPFGINDSIEVYLDESLKKYETVFPACGSSNSAIELTIKELEKTSQFIKWIDIGKEII